MVATNTTVIDPTISAMAVEIDAQVLADQYLVDTLGPNFHAVRGFFGNQCWYFLIQHQSDADTEPIGVGAKLIVDTQHNAVLPLTDEQIQDILEASRVQRDQMRGEVARDADGYLLRFQAKRNATAYLRQHLSMHFSATDGLLLPLPNSVWQFSIRCQMGRIGELGPLGIVDVDAHSGDVIPLQSSQLQQIRNRVDAIIEHRALATVA